MNGASRDARYELELITELHEPGVKLVCVNQGLTFDESATSQFMLAVFGALASVESDIKSERIKARLEVAKANGSRLGRPRDKAKPERVRNLRPKGWSVQRIAATIRLTKAGVYYLLASA